MYAYKGVHWTYIGFYIIISWIVLQHRVFCRILNLAYIIRDIDKGQDRLCLIPHHV